MKIETILKQENNTNPQVWAGYSSMISRSTPKICIASSLVGVITIAPVPFLGSILQT